MSHWNWHITEQCVKCIKQEIIQVLPNKFMIINAASQQSGLREWLQQMFFALVCWILEHGTRYVIGTLNFDVKGEWICWSVGKKYKKQGSLSQVSEIMGQGSKSSTYFFSKYMTFYPNHKFDIWNKSKTCATLSTQMSPNASYITVHKSPQSFLGFP